jgi:transcriptional regulator of arginine metabolism
MGFVKIRVRPGEYKYELLEKASEELVWERLRLLFHNFVMDIKSTKNLVLIKTSPGNANGVASLIDSIERAEILGTVAGDDTILVVVDTDRNRAKVESAFRRLL